jgi:glycosyltransferase involved in cell wall biosynthesis
VIDSRRIAVVIPAKDEARFIGAVVSTLPDFVDQVVVVDDGSVDDTSARARAARDDVDIVRHEVSRGVGAAIAAGYRRALAGGAEVMAVMAGDGQMDPQELGRVVAPVVLGCAGYVKGDRLAHRDVWRQMPWPRLVGTASLGLLTSVVVGVPIRDSQCGYTAISREALERIDLDDIWIGYGYPNDMIAALARAGVIIDEVRVRPIYRDEVSGLKPRHVLTILWLLGRAARRRASAAMRG